MSEKISDMAVASLPLSGTEKVEIVQGSGPGSNKQTTVQDIANLGGGGGTWGSITGTLSSQTDLQSALDNKVSVSGSQLHATATGTNTYAATLTPTPAYASGLTIRIKFTNGNTGASTINLNGLGAKSIKKNVSSDLASGDIPAGAIVEMVYDGTNFQAIGIFTAVGATWGSITGTLSSQSDLQTALNAKADASALTSGLALKVAKAGDSMTGPLAMGTNKVTGLAAGSAAGDALRYEQVYIDWTTLTDGATTTWDTLGLQNPIAKWTMGATSRTLAMSNLKSGASGLLVVKTGVSGAITVTFPAGSVTDAGSLTPYTFPAGINVSYDLSWYYDSSTATIKWLIGVSNIDTDSTFAANSDLLVPSQKAVKTALANLTAASESGPGIIEIATDAETKAGTDDARAVTPLKLLSKLAQRSSKTANYSIVAADKETLITMNSASTVTVTVDQMSTDYKLGVINIGAGQVSFAAGTGVTLAGITSIPGNSKSGVLIIFTSATTAYVMGAGDVSFADLINKPTTVGGYFITDGVSVLFNTFTTVGNVGTGDDVLHTYAIPAGTLGIDAQTIVLESAGQFAATANNKRVRVKFGATTVLDTGALVTTVATNWFVRAIVIRTAATTQRCIAFFSNDDGTNQKTFTQYTTPAENTAGSITMTVNGDATSNNDVTATFTKIRKEGAA